MSYNTFYTLILKVFTDEIIEKGLLSKIKHLANKRIEEIALKGLELCVRGRIDAFILLSTVQNKMVFREWSLAETKA